MNKWGWQMFPICKPLLRTNVSPQVLLRQPPGGNCFGNKIPLSLPVAKPHISYWVLLRRPVTYWLQFYFISFFFRRVENGVRVFVLEDVLQISVASFNPMQWISPQLIFNSLNRTVAAAAYQNLPSLCELEMQFNVPPCCWTGVTAVGRNEKCWATERKSDNIWTGTGYWKGKRVCVREKEREAHGGKQGKMKERNKEGPKGNRAGLKRRVGGWKRHILEDRNVMLQIVFESETGDSTWFDFCKCQCTYCT